MDILEEIIAYKRVEIEAMKRDLPPRRLYSEVEAMMDTHAVSSMRKHVLEAEVGIIAEFKRRSPSKGWICQEARADIVPAAYEKGGAAAVSILTDERFFGGCDDFVGTARSCGVRLPILYKNFVVDEYQLFLARRCGASAVLLIAACLSAAQCRTLQRTAHEIGLEVLLELHSERELHYADILPDMCGVNNRNLGTFVTDVQNSFSLAGLLPEDICKVSESGIEHPHTIRLLQQAGYSGFLIGETFMRASQPGEAVREFIEQTKNIQIYDN